MPSDTPTPTTTPTLTPTATSTNTPADDGASCTDPVDCISRNCVDDVCCDDACDQPGEVCNLEGEEGTCVQVASPAPAASHTGLWIAVGLLLAIGAFALARRRGAYLGR